MARSRAGCSTTSSSPIRGDCSGLSTTLADFLLMPPLAAYPSATGGKTIHETDAAVGEAHGRVLFPAQLLSFSFLARSATSTGPPMPLGAGIRAVVLDV